jgi:hypothetical protein
MELNPVRAGLVPDAGDWRWTSARAHLSGRDDRLVEVAPLLAMVADWRGSLTSATSGGGAGARRKMRRSHCSNALRRKRSLKIGCNSFLANHFLAFFLGFGRRARTLLARIWGSSGMGFDVNR